MREVLRLALSLSFSGSLLIVGLLFCRPLYRNRLSKRWQYYIWLIVLARLLLPFTPETSLVGMLFQEEAPAAQAGDPVSRGPVQYEPERFAALPPQDETRLPEPASPGPEVLWEKALPNLWLIWLGTALVLFVRKLTVYQSFARYVKAGRAEVSDPALLDRLARLGESAGVKRPVELYVNPLISSPLLTGFFRPCIVLPSAGLPEADFQNTILHELAHYKRGDMFYKWLVQLAVCLHWFNPLVYRMQREISRACELSCDEAVIRSLDMEGRRAYGDTLLNAAGAGGGYRDSLASVTLHESAEQLKERLCAIMSYQKKSKWVTAGSLLLAALAITGGIVAGAYKAPEYEAAEPERQVIMGVETNTDLPSQELKEGDSSGMVVLGSSYFTRESYYQAPYLFEIGYNVPENWVKDYSSRVLTLSSGSMRVYYGEACKTVMQDAGTVKALSALLSRLRDETAGTEFALLRPVVYGVENTGGKPLAALAEQYYDESSLPDFGAVFALLDQKEQEAWLKKLLEENSIALFASALNNLPEGSPLISTMAEWAYAKEDIVFFSVAAQHMTQAELEAWLARAVQDRRTSFRAMLLQAADKDGEYEAWKDELDRQRLDEYRAHGVTKDGTAYYYQGQRVRILRDLRESDQSFVTLETDPKGTVDIKILRDASDNIQSVSYMTPAEVEALFGDSWEDGGGWDDDAWDGETLPFQRLSWEDAPEQVQTILEAGKPNEWRATEYGGRRYVFYKGLPGDYVWEPSENGKQVHISIRDSGTSQPAKAGYVLLSVSSAYSLSVSYNGKAVSLAELPVKSTGGSNDGIPFYTPDAGKTIAIPVSIPSIGAGKAVCIAAIPNVTSQNGRQWTYDVTAKNIRGLFVGMAYDCDRTGKDGVWYNYCGGAEEEDPFPSNRLYCQGTEFGSNTTSGDTFYVYAGSAGQALEDVEGTILIQYQ